MRYLFSELVSAFYGILLSLCFSIAVLFAFNIQIVVIHVPICSNILMNPLQ